MPKYVGLEEYVFRTFERMYEVFERDRHLIAPGQFCEVRYEELVANPIEQMRRVYAELQLGDFEAARPAISMFSCPSASTAFSSAMAMICIAACR